MPLKTYSSEQLQQILADHRLWLDTRFTSEVRGNRADLSYADLSYANLSSANLSYANLSYANLRSADLSSANLSSANLSSANLSLANLRYANLYNANLRSADLGYANLSLANLRYANLSYANLSYARLPPIDIFPEEGSFIAWKKVCGNLVLKLEVFDKRTASLIGRKCRANKVRVLEVFDLDKNPVKNITEFRSTHDNSFVYKLGEIVEAELNDDIRLECTSGIHFFMTFKEAAEY